jgi:hypothetical protein
MRPRQPTVNMTIETLKGWMAPFGACGRIFLPSISSWNQSTSFIFGSCHGLCYSHSHHGELVFYLELAHDLNCMCACMCELQNAYAHWYQANDYFMRPHRSTKVQGHVPLFFILFYNQPILPTAWGPSKKRADQACRGWTSGPVNPCSTSLWPNSPTCPPMAAQPT